MVNNKKVDSIKLDYLIQSKQLSQICKVHQKPYLISVDLVMNVSGIQISCLTQESESLEAWAMSHYCADMGLIPLWKGLNLAAQKSGGTVQGSI